MTVRVTPLHGPGAGAYYVQEVGSYYLQAGEPAGVWFGRAAECLGLYGSVDAAASVRLLDGVDPSTGEALGQAFIDKSVRGFDVTFSAPKSVSLAAAVADDSVRAEFLAAHDAAVTGVLKVCGEPYAHALASEW